MIAQPPSIHDFGVFRHVAVPLATLDTLCAAVIQAQIRQPVAARLEVAPRPLGEDPVLVLTVIAGGRRVAPAPPDPVWAAIARAFALPPGSDERDLLACCLAAIFGTAEAVLAEVTGTPAVTWWHVPVGS